MRDLKDLQPNRVFHYFEEISQIPRGSGNRKGISQYCVDFANRHHLRAICDDANNVVIFKDGTKEYENADPIILQGHLDMVCQKTPDCDIDFEKDGLRLYVEGDFLKADGTTLGADNGIAVAMILAILESDTIAHPPIEAVFTTDEEIGMLGAVALDMEILKGKRMINLDAEDALTLTVSCAGGSDFKMFLPIQREIVSGNRVVLTLKGLKGGHSGVEIHAGRVNADILAGRVLNDAKKVADYGLLAVSGGDKGNAIPLHCQMELVVQNPESFVEKMQEYLTQIVEEIKEREANFTFSFEILEEGSYSVMDTISRDKLIYALLCVPNGVMEMSASIEGLVETSLNLGVLKTEEEQVFFHLTLRSNKKTALHFLEERLIAFSKGIGCNYETSGYYPPWEYRENSKLQKTYQEVCKAHYGKEAKVVAIHAGLECAVFASKIKDLDCIAIGAEMFDIHTTQERLSISSTEDTYQLLLEILKNAGKKS